MRNSRYPQSLRGRLCRLVSPMGAMAPDGSQDAFLDASRLEPDERVLRALPAGASAYAQVARGRVEVNGTALGTEAIQRR